MKNVLIEELKKEISGIKTGPQKSEVGTVVRVGDSVVEIIGLGNVKAGEIISFDDSDTTGVVQNLEETSVKAVILTGGSNVKEGTTVKGTGELLSIKVSDKLLGRVIDPLGNPKDGKGPITDDGISFPLFKIAPGVITRESVKTPLHTGISAIDGMIPIGRGQRQLIIGDRGTGKTAIVIDAIVNQKNDTREKPVVCIYVAIGQKESKVAHIVEELRKEGALPYTVVVSAAASDLASLQYIAPYAGCAIGEYFMSKGQDALVIYDDLSKHATAYRELALLLRRPPGREAFPGDIFYLHSSLLERAAKLNKDFGGGSLTALPIIETQLGEISAYIPTNVISITDGQIYLEPELFYQGTRPAINVGLSVSRVGSAAQTKAMKKVAGTLRLELAQFRELAAFAQFGSELDEATKKKIERGRRLSELLKQPRLETIPFEEEVASIFSGVRGFLDTVPVEKIAIFNKNLRAFLHKKHSTLLSDIRSKGELTKEIDESLSNAITDFANNYFEKVS